MHRIPDPGSRSATLFVSSVPGSHDLNCSNLYGTVMKESEFKLHVRHNTISTVYRIPTRVRIAEIRPTIRTKSWKSHKVTVKGVVSQDGKQLKWTFLYVRSCFLTFFDVMVLTKIIIYRVHIFCFRTNLIILIIIRTPLQRRMKHLQAKKKIPSGSCLRLVNFGNFFSFH